MCETDKDFLIEGCSLVGIVGICKSPGFQKSNRQKSYQIFITILKQFFGRIFRRNFMQFWVEF